MTCDHCGVQALRDHEPGCPEISAQLDAENARLRAERRERYATAIEQFFDQAYSGILSLSAADAVMAVADQEITAVQDGWCAATRNIREANARLRAELERYRYAIDVQYPPGMRAPMAEECWNPELCWDPEPCGGCSKAPRSVNRYALTIFRARYGGTYEGAEYLAFNAWMSDIEDAQGNDLTCSNFFATYPRPIGRGATPEKARLSLLRHLAEERNVL